MTLDKAQFVYVTYISTTPEKLWVALTDPQLTRQYWERDNVSDWKPGSKWEHRRSDAAHTVDRIDAWSSRYFGPVILSGRTHSSNCCSVTCPSESAAALSVVPSRCAFLAIAAALS